MASLDPKFRFSLKENVKIKASGETGQVIGRAQYAEAKNSYYVRYKAHDGRAVEQWWSEPALDWAD